MARTPDGTQARTEVIHVRIATTGLDALDDFRGAWGRSEYIRRCIAYAIKNGMRGPETVDW